MKISLELWLETNKKNRKLMLKRWRLHEADLHLYLTGQKDISVEIGDRISYDTKIPLDTLDRDFKLRKKGLEVPLDLVDKLVKRQKAIEKKAKVILGPPRYHCYLCHDRKVIQRRGLKIPCAKCSKKRNGKKRASEAIKRETINSRLSTNLRNSPIRSDMGGTSSDRTAAISNEGLTNEDEKVNG